MIDMYNWFVNYYVITALKIYKYIIWLLIILIIIIDIYYIKGAE